MRRRAPRAALALSLLATALGGLPAAADVQVEARLEPREVPAGRGTRLVVEVHGGVFDRLQPRASFETDNLEIVAGPEWIDNIQWVNGVTRRSITLVWLLRAEEPGSAMVHSLVVEVGGERYELPALQAQVVAGTAEDENGRTPAQRRPLPRWRLPDPLSDLLDRRWPTARPEPPELHLVAEATPVRVWRGEQVLYTLYLYTQSSIDSVSANALPDFRGFWVEEVPRADGGQEAERVQWRGEVFWRTALLSRVLFPLRPGRHRIGPAEVEALPRPDADPWAARSIVATPPPKVLAAGPLVIDVLPLPPPPTGMVGSFDGLVGSFELDARLLRPTVEAGEAALLEVTLAGRGDLESIDAPSLPRLEGVEVLPAQEEGGNRITGNGVEARRVWRFPLVPERAGRRRLPPIEVAYFDPSSGTYRWAVSDPLSLTVLPATVVGHGDPHPIRNAALPTGAGRPTWSRLVPWAFALPWLLALVVGLTGRRRTGAVAGRPGDDPCRLLELRLAAAVGQQRPRRAARALEDAWREFLESTAGLPPTLASADWAAALPAAVRAGGRGEELARLVDDLHYLRHAPQLSAVGELTREVLERSRRLAPRLAACGRRTASGTDGGPSALPTTAPASNA